MKHRSRMNTAGLTVVLCALGLAVGGCNREAAAEIALLSSAYLGDVVTALSTACLQEAWGIEIADAHAHDEEHSHAAVPLYDHDH